MYSVINNKLGSKSLMVSWKLNDEQRSRVIGSYPTIEAAKEAHPDVKTEFESFIDPEVLDKVNKLNAQ